MNEPLNQIEYEINNEKKVENYKIIITKIYLQYYTL